MSMSEKYFVGCDVGSTSVRAGLFDSGGKMITSASHPIQTWRPETNFVQQSSEDIWRACCHCFASILSDSGIPNNMVHGIGFDATCSLVVLGEDDKPLSVGPDASDEQNIIVWMDHRAIREAQEINDKNHPVLQYVGGTISPEMQTPKLLWLKRNKPDTWNKARKFFDLSDYLVYRATGQDVRSVCTTTCKWTYLGHEESASAETVGRWDDSFFRDTGLEEFVSSGYGQIGKIIRQVGEAVGNGLNKTSAHETGFLENTSVGVAMIDAHAGGLGLLGMAAEGAKADGAKVDGAKVDGAKVDGANADDFKADGSNADDSNADGSNAGAIDFERRLALIGGTSSCHMVVSGPPRFVKGVWGPYYSAMIPDMWLNEGGQSATGALVDHVIFSSSAAAEVSQIAEKENKSVYHVLNSRLAALAKKQNLDYYGKLTRRFHVLPYFHGNRSPRANPNLKGGVSGFQLSSTIDDLAVYYLATIQAIAYGTRHIIEELNDNGYAIDTIMATGGGTKNEIFLQEHANITGCHIVLPEEQEAVLLGSAILGAVASGLYPSIQKAMEKMNRAGKVIPPESGSQAVYHQKKYEIFHKMYQDQKSYDTIMDVDN